MKKILPEEFLKRMKVLLGDEYDAFLKTYNETPVRGLRLNLSKLATAHDSTHKISYQSLLHDWKLMPLDEGAQKTSEDTEAERSREFYINEERLAELGIRPGKHPYHEAGVYYIQEPSAMQVVEQLDIRPFDRVMDLCASPGGKSTQAADHLDPELGGLIISNEYVASRARTLSSNFERMGILNGAVLNEDTGRLAAYFPGYFSRIIVDAPCSGEGMFRKDDTAISEWSPDNVLKCIIRQKEIVANAVKMLASGGKMSYSTCTFEPGEDEEMAQYILTLDPELELIYEKKLWPHKERGEGHYIAVFKKRGPETVAPEPCSLDLFRETGFRRKKGKDLDFLIPEYMPDLRGLHVLREGVPFAERLKNRLEPAHALSHAIRFSKDAFQMYFSLLDLSVDDPRVGQYLHGLEISASQDELVPAEAGEKVENPFKGYVLIACDGQALGFGKYSNSRIKNHYPKGLRFV